MMCKQTVCIKWWMAVIVAFLWDTASPLRTSAEGATWFSPGKFWKFKAEWWHLEVFVALFSCQNQKHFFLKPCARSCVFAYRELHHCRQFQLVIQVSMVLSNQLEKLSMIYVWVTQYYALRQEVVSIKCISARYLEQFFQVGTLQWVKVGFIISQYGYINS